MKPYLFLLICLSIVFGCKGKKDQVKNLVSASYKNKSGVLFAQGFSLEQHRHKTILSVKNPWQHASGVEYNYILSDTIAATGIINDNTWAIKTPVKRIICLSTTHLGFVDYLNRTETICGISGKDYVVNEKIRKGISDNRISDVGYDENLNYEQILKLRPDVVFAYGVNVAVTATLKKLNELGIPVIMIGEYLEGNPLAKMEWLKAFAACYELNKDASVRFDSVVQKYNGLVRLADSAPVKPTVLLGLPWKGSWYISGSKSYIARLIRDAGGKYIFDYLDYNESRPMGLETIYEKALSADLWINPGEAHSINEILSVDERFGSLSSIVNKCVYNNDNQLTRSGGNDFYESGVVEPDIILSDLIAIMHPQLLPSYQLKYYRKLQ